MSFLTRWFSNSFQGIPQITSAAGTLVGALDAMLVNGFNEQTATSLTQTAGVATLTFSGSGHGFVQHSVIRISGASPAGWNGDYRVTGVSGANVTFACDDTLSAASGTISVKFAPADFEIVYTGTNKRVYRSSALDSTQLMLRVDDTTTTLASCTLYEDMSDIDTGSLSRSVYHYKRNLAENATYCFYSDDRLFYLFSDCSNNATWGGLLIFGDIVSYRAGDAYHCALAGQEGTNGLHNFGRISADASYCALARGTDGMPGYAAFSLLTLNVNSAFLGQSSQVDPNPSTNGIHPVPVYVRCESDVRGIMPGIYHAANTIERTQGTVFDVPGLGIVIRQVLYGGACYMSLGGWRV